MIGSYGVMWTGSALSGMYDAVGICMLSDGCFFLG